MQNVLRNLTGCCEKKMTFSALNLAIVALNFAIIAKFNIAKFNATPVCFLKSVLLCQCVCGMKRD